MNFAGVMFCVLIFSIIDLFLCVGIGAALAGDVGGMAGFIVAIGVAMVGGYATSDFLTSQIK